MVAEMLAVVRGEYDQGALVLAARAQALEQASDLGVDLAHHRVVVGTRLADVTVTECEVVARIVVVGDARPALVMEVPGKIGVLSRFLLRRGCSHRQWRVAGIVHRIAGRGGDERRVGRQIGQMHEPRLLSLRAQVLDHLLGEEADGPSSTG